MTTLRSALALQLFILCTLGPPPVLARNGGADPATSDTVRAGSESPADREEPGGIEIDAVYTGDLFGTLSGGRRTGTDYLGDLSVTIELDAGALLGWSGGTFFFYSLANHGGEPSERIGDVQIASNIEAPDTWKIYEAWYQQNLFAGRVSALIGLYDLNSEFDVIESAGLFLNSSFGIGADYSQSGRNGPSIFPTTSLGLRVSARPGRSVLFRTAALDAVAGDPDDPHGTHVILDEDEGALIAWEGVLYLGLAAEPRGTRRRIGRGHETPPYRGKFAVGGWHYTATFPRVAADLDAGDPSRHGSHGLYALGEYRLWSERADPDQGLTIFGRLGWADPTVNRLVAYTGVGVVYHGPVPGRHADRLGLGLAAAHNGDTFEEARTAAGQPVEASEVTLELTYRAQVTDWLAIQPDVQYVINPGTEPDLDDALVVAGRFELSH